MKYKLERIISDNRNFLVLEVKDENDKSEVCYISRDLDLNKKTFTKDDLQILWGDKNERKRY